MQRFKSLIEQRSDAHMKISSQDLRDLGNAEDYLRVASNVSTTLEMVLAEMVLVDCCRQGGEKVEDHIDYREVVGTKTPDDIPRLISTRVGVDLFENGSSAKLDRSSREHHKNDFRDLFSSIFTDAFTFASSTMPIISVVLLPAAKGKTVHLVGDFDDFFGTKSRAQKWGVIDDFGTIDADCKRNRSARKLAKEDLSQMLNTLNGGNVVWHEWSMEECLDEILAKKKEGDIVLLHQNAANQALSESRPTQNESNSKNFSSSHPLSSAVSKIDGIVAPHLLYISNPNKICPADILTLRKRMAMPITTPVAESMLEDLCANPRESRAAESSVPNPQHFCADPQVDSNMKIAADLLGEKMEIAKAASRETVLHGKYLPKAELEKFTARVEQLVNRPAHEYDEPESEDMATRFRAATGSGRMDDANSPVENSCLPKSAHVSTRKHQKTQHPLNFQQPLLPLVFSAGLPALSTLFLALLARPNSRADVIMCTTAYGGCSQLVDLLQEKSSDRLRKFTFEIPRGPNDSLSTTLEDSICGTLEKVTAIDNEEKEKDHDSKITVLFLEVPTNPDMRVPDVAAIAEKLRDFRTARGRKSDSEIAPDEEVLLLLDVTFAPNSNILQKVEAAGIPAIAFMSMSKSISRGLTTAGSLVANEHAKKLRMLEHSTLVEEIEKTGDLLDSFATVDQMQVLLETHEGVEDRCQQAYQNARLMGEVLQNAVKRYNGGCYMPLAFVTPEEAAIGFTSPTFSFNLPSPHTDDAKTAPEYSPAVLPPERLAQTFVDLICAHPQYFKPCVSFGQDNGLVYATVPATSTQGAIRAEDKAKQAVRGVQLARLSFPARMHVDAVSNIITDAVRTIYSIARNVGSVGTNNMHTVGDGAHQFGLLNTSERSMLGCEKREGEIISKKMARRLTHVAILVN